MIIWIALLQRRRGATRALAPVQASAREPEGWGNAGNDDEPRRGGTLSGFGFVPWAVFCATFSSTRYSQRLASSLCIRYYVMRLVLLYIANPLQR
jgi:hypothetical protein